MTMNGAQIHLLINHFPVIAYPIIVFALLWSIVRKENSVFIFCAFLTLLTWAITIITYLTGDGAEDTLRDLPNFNINLIHAHEDTAFIAMILSSIVAVVAVATLPIAQRKFSILQNVKTQKFLKIGFLIGALFITIALAVAAHQGGLIVHSEIR
jgi:hypothetical protein